jgi:hypothetical protein
VPLLQECSEHLLVTVPVGGQIGICMHLIRRELKGLCSALGVPRAQCATVLAIAGHQLRTPPMGGNPLDVSQSTDL